MMLSRRVSVVIPCHNAGPMLLDAIQSVLDQTSHAHEIIVVDDGSTDGTGERTFPEGVRYLSQAHSGVASARNRGIDAATGDVIAFLDADDVWHPRKLELQLDAWTTNPDLVLLGGYTYQWPCSAHPSIEGSCGRDVIRVTVEQLLVENRIVTSTVLVRSDVFRRTGKFDCSLQGPEDFDMWLRIGSVGNLAILKDRVAGYRVGTIGSLSKNGLRMERDLLSIFKKMDAAGVFVGRRSLRRKTLAYLRYSCGLMHRDEGRLSLSAKRFAMSLISWPFRIHEGRNGGGLIRLRMLAATIGMAVRPRSR